jgi:hypothetical protein
MSTYVCLVLGCRQAKSSSSNRSIVSKDSKIARDSRLPYAVPRAFLLNFDMDSNEGTFQADPRMLSGLDLYVSKSMPSGDFKKPAFRARTPPTFFL